MRKSQLFFEVVFRDKYSLVETISETYRPPCYIIVKHTWIYNEKENDDIESFLVLNKCDEDKNTEKRIIYMTEIDHQNKYW